MLTYIQVKKYLEIHWATGIVQKKVSNGIFKIELFRLKCFLPDL